MSIVRVLDAHVLDLGLRCYSDEMLKVIGIQSLLAWFCILLGALGISCARFESERQIEIKVFFTNNRDVQGDCMDGEFVTRKIPAMPNVEDAALRTLFAGPTDEEKARALYIGERFADYYLGISIDDGVATVNFRAGAEGVLHVGGAQCERAGALAPIYRTLSQFQRIRSIEIKIDGETPPWDA
jgi:spore germination protein GerM